MPGQRDRRVAKPSATVLPAVSQAERDAGVAELALVAFDLVMQKRSTTHSSKTNCFEHVPVFVGSSVSAGPIVQCWSICSSVLVHVLKAGEP